MKELTKTEIKSTYGGSETFRRFGEWLATQRCRARNRHEIYLEYKEKYNFM